MRNSLATVASLLTATAALFAAPATAQAPSHVTDVRTVADLAAVCDPRLSGMERLESIAYCQGYVTAAGQYHALTHPAGGPRRSLYCLPNPPPSIAQAGLGFAAWARQNPQHAGEPALDGLFRYAQSAYRCPADDAAATARHARSGPAR
jgi:hypothetical protein